MTAANAANSLGARESNLLMEDPDLAGVVDFLTDPKADSIKQTAVVRALHEAGISRVRDTAELARKKRELIARLREEAEELFAPAPLPKGGITDKNVDALLARHATHPVIRMAMALPEAADRVRALELAGIRLDRQLHVENEGQMEVLRDKVAEVLTNISILKGQQARILPTPTGSGRRR